MKHKSFQSVLDLPLSTSDRCLSWNFFPFYKTLMHIVKLTNEVLMPYGFQMKNQEAINQGLTFHFHLKEQVKTHQQRLPVLRSPGLQMTAGKQKIRMLKNLFAALNLPFFILFLVSENFSDLTFTSLTLFNSFHCLMGRLHGKFYPAILGMKF